jgi:hypothetical protein
MTAPGECITTWIAQHEMHTGTPKELIYNPLLCPINVHSRDQGYLGRETGVR